MPRPGATRSLLLLLALGTALVVWTRQPAPTTGPLVRITIPQGAAFRVVADSLAVHGLIGSPLWFRALARLRGVDRRVQAGVYDVPAGVSSWRVLSIMQDGKVALVRLTVPEGLTVLELAELAQSRLGIPGDSLKALARDTGFVRSLGIEAPELEGYLLPETYSLPLPVTAADLLRAMVTEFNRRWVPGWDRRLDTLGLTRNQLVTLASIVEGEARHDDERGTIAGVYLNRLRRGIALQADPTVQYALQLATGERKTRLLFKDLEIQSRYNTYLHSGLPPGPVNSPGVRSLEAALYPATVPWLYFVAGPDGYHIFSRTLEEHNRAIAAVRHDRPRGR